MDELVSIHSGVRWLVLVALVGGAAIALRRYRRKDDWSDSIYSWVAVTVDLQVTIGIVLWIGNRGFSQGFFIAVIHPVFMLGALGVVHAGMRMARSRADGSAHAVVGLGMFLALALVLAAIPWGR